VLILNRNDRRTLTATMTTVRAITRRGDAAAHLAQEARSRIEESERGGKGTAIHRRQRPVVIQGNCSGVRIERVGVVLVGMLLVLLLGLSGCSRAVHAPVSTTDHSELAPADLLKQFLETERSKDAVKFVFKGEIEVEAGKPHKFRGYCGYTPCGSLRMKLLGPMGLTVLDYLNAEGEVTIRVNHLTDDGDEEALRGLTTLMENFTRALLDRCRATEEYLPGSEDAATVTFGLRGADDPTWSWTLDRRRGVVVRQTTAGTEIPDLDFDYLDYEWLDGFWMPATIEVHRADADVELSIQMTVRKWELRADLPEAFFE
jgi:hypothetical protein